MTPADLQPITAAIAGAIIRGVRPVVLALEAGTTRAEAVHAALEGGPMPDVPPAADPNDPRLHFLVLPRERVAEALRRSCGSAGAAIAREIMDDGGPRIDGHLVVVRADGIGSLGIRDGKGVSECGRTFDAEDAKPERRGGIPDRGPSRAPARRRRRGR